MTQGTLRNQVFVITGPSGVGKGTLIRLLLAECPDLELAVSCTTRAPRHGEEEGRDYYFISPSDFQDKVDQERFVEYATYAGNSYGTLVSELTKRAEADKQVLLEMNVQGTRQLRCTYPQARRIFIAPPSLAVLRQQLTDRGTDTPEQITHRLEIAEQEIATEGEFDHVIVNDDLSQALAELVAIVNG